MMVSTILQRIINDKKQWIIQRKQQQPLASLLSQIIPSQRSFYQALQHQQPVFILECKKASPSKGIIRQDFDPFEIAKVYKKFATALSVVTDEHYFKGSFDFLTQVSQSAPQPVLCKDFIIDPYQIYLARYYQADAILLMLSILSDAEYQQLSRLAHQFNMGILTEVTNEIEVKRALRQGAKVIGINNRNLHDLSVDLQRTQRLAPLIPNNITLISESGITSHHQVMELSKIVDGFLIGSALMLESDLRSAVCRILFGVNKICGLTRPEDAAAAYHYGALYGGLIFIPSSPRYVNVLQAKNIVTQAALQYVGVFCDAKLDHILDLVTRLNLQAVQLHGAENSSYIQRLRAMLPNTCQIWKAFSISTTLPQRNLHAVDRYLFDNAAGGSGQPFNWKLLQGERLDNVILAGGLKPENCAAARQLGCAGLDFNSGLEKQPGIKDLTRIAKLFKTLRMPSS